MDRNVDAISADDIRLELDVRELDDREIEVLSPGVTSAGTAKHELIRVDTGQALDRQTLVQAADLLQMMAPERSLSGQPSAVVCAVRVGRAGPSTKLNQDLSNLFKVRDPSTWLLAYLVAEHMVFSPAEQMKLFMASEDDSLDIYAYVQAPPPWLGLPIDPDSLQKMGWIERRELVQSACSNIG
jgi:hypothetical protein